jgi:hypothetical protein
MKHYKTIVSSSKTFDDKVTEALNDGWTLYGSPYIRQISTGFQQYQAVVKEDQPIVPTRDLSGF